MNNDWTLDSFINWLKGMSEKHPNEQYDPRISFEIYGKCCLLNDYARHIGQKPMTLFELQEKFNEKNDNICHLLGNMIWSKVVAPDEWHDPESYWRYPAAYQRALELKAKVMHVL